MNGTSQSLLGREWLVVMVIVLFILYLTRVASHAPQNRWPEKQGLGLQLPEEQIVITVAGAVEVEGRYHFNKGATVGEVLTALKLKENADIGKLPLNQKVKKGQKLRIPTKKAKKHNKSIE